MPPPAPIAPCHPPGNAEAPIRRALPFRNVNRREAPHYNPGLHRHHLLPRQLLTQGCFGAMFTAIGCARVGFEDFRSNGLLLPADDATARRFGLPLHRGPHRDYNAMVIARVGEIEVRWAGLRPHAPELARDHAVARLRALQAALRRRLLDPARGTRTLARGETLGMRLGKAIDFSELDAMAEALWSATGG